MCVRAMSVPSRRVWRADMCRDVLTCSPSASCRYALTYSAGASKYLVKGDKTAFPLAHRLSLAALGSSVFGVARGEAGGLASDGVRVSAVRRIVVFERNVCVSLPRGPRGLSLYSSAAPCTHTYNLHLADWRVLHAYTVTVRCQWRV